MQQRALGSLPHGDEQANGQRAHHHQEIRQPAPLQHAVFQLHHARGPLADDPRRGRFPGLDAKTGNDITHQILTQIIMEEESHGEQMLPISFLRQLISMYGNSMQQLMPHYLEATMDNFRANQLKLQETWKASMGPDALAKMAETNMAMFKAAASAFMPGGKPLGGEPPAATPRVAGRRPRGAARADGRDAAQARRAGPLGPLGSRHSRGGALGRALQSAFR
jgi:polyhydroxyalkanoate synthesis repressor PhaR